MQGDSRLRVRRLSRCALTPLQVGPLQGARGAEGRYNLPDPLNTLRCWQVALNVSHRTTFPFQADWLLGQIKEIDGTFFMRREVGYIHVYV